MSTKKLLSLTLGSVLFVGCLTGCGVVAASQGGTSLPEVNFQQVSNEPTPSLAVFAEDGAECKA